MGIHIHFGQFHGQQNRAHFEITGTTKVVEWRSMQEADSTLQFGGVDHRVKSFGAERLGHRVPA